MTLTTASLPHFHDGLIKGFLVENDEVRLFVQTESGVPFTLVLSGVERLSIDGFALGNIILDCEFLDGRDIPTDILVALNHGGTCDKGLERLRAIVAEGTYRLFCISPSYGATVVALVKGFSVQEGISIA